MDIPPPPPPPPSPDDVPPPGPTAGPPSPYGAKQPSPYDSPQPSYGGPQSNPYGAPQDGPPPSEGLPSYPQSQQQQPYGQQAYGQESYGQQTYGQQPPYGGAPGAPGPYGAPYGAQGPYGAPPYPGQPQGWYAVNRTTNGMSIASLVLGFTCIPLLGIIFGIVGLKQIKRRGERGRGMAIAGITLSSIGTLGLAVVIGLGAAGVFDEGNTAVRDIQAGQCFNTVGDKLSDYAGEGARSTSVNVVSCDTEHDAEAFAVFTIDSTPSQAFPGVDAETDIAQNTCTKYAGVYVGGSSSLDGQGLYFYLPPKDGWERHQRSVVCFFGGKDGRTTGSVKGDGTGGTPSTSSDDDGGDNGFGV